MISNPAPRFRLTNGMIVESFMEEFGPRGVVEARIGELSARREGLIDELRFDIFALTDTLKIEKHVDYEASRLLLLSGYREELQDVHRNLSRLIALRRAASGEPERPDAVTPDMKAAARKIPCEALLVGCELRRMGKRFWCRCPFHFERTASFEINSEKNRWRCRGACAIGGDVIDLYQRLHRVGFRVAVRALAGGVA